MLKLPYQITQVENDSVPLVIQPGYFSIFADRDGQGRWKDGNMVRFAPSSGLPTKIGGWVNVTPTNLNAGQGFKGVLRAAHEWQSLDRQFWLAVGTHSKLYLYNQGVMYDITPTRRTSTLVNAFSTTAGSSTVTVTDPLHSAFVGDNVQFSGASTFNNVTINGEYTIQSSTLNTYTIVAATTANATGSGGGTAVATYDINSMAIDSSQLLGWGASTWDTPRLGGLGWDAPAASSNISAPVGLWSLDNWGEDLIASPRGGGIYLWHKQNGPFARATVVSANAPLFNNKVIVAQDARQIIAFGSSSGDNQGNPVGPLDPSLIRWCNSEDFGTWVASATNTAGALRLNSGSGIVTVTKTRGGYYMGSTSASALLYASGDSNIYLSNPLGKSSRPCSPQAAADFNGVSYIMAQDNFQRFDGVLTTMNCDVWNAVFDPQLPTSLNKAKMEKVTCHINRSFTEVWWNYPSIASSPNLLLKEDGADILLEDGASMLLLEDAATPAVENDRYVAYNWQLNCWHYGAWSANLGGDINRSMGHDYGDVFQAPYMAYFNTASTTAPNLNGWSQLFTHEVGALANGFIGFGEFVQSWDVDILNSGELVSISHLLPNFKEFVSVGGDSPQISVSLQIRKYPSDTPKQKGPYLVTPTTTKVAARGKGRQVSLLIGGQGGSGVQNLRLLQSGDFRLLENGVDFRLLEGTGTSQGVVWSMGQWRVKMGEDGDR